MTSVARVLVTGAGGFIGHHLVRRLKKDGAWVRGVDLKYPEFESTAADEFEIAARFGHLDDTDFGHLRISSYV